MLIWSVVIAGKCSIWVVRMSDGFVSPADVADTGSFADDDGNDEFPGVSSEDTSGGSLRAMLSSTEPDISPHEVSGFIDLSVPWFNHLEVMVQKMSSSGGIPAWANGMIAIVALLKQSGAMPDMDRDTSDDDEEGTELPVVSE